MGIVSLIAGLVFGVGSGFFEKIIAQPIGKQINLSGSELTIVSFGGLMLMASIIVSAMGADSSAFWLVLGGMIGAFAIRGYLFGKSKVDERKAAKEVASDVAGDVKEAVEEATN